MAKRGRTELTQEEKVIRFLRKEGFHELTEAEKKLPRLRKDIAEFESYIGQKREHRPGVREKRASYRIKRATRAKSQA